MQKISLITHKWRISYDTTTVVFLSSLALSSHTWNLVSHPQQTLMMSLCLSRVSYALCVMRTELPLLCIWCNFLLEYFATEEAQLAWPPSAPQRCSALFSLPLIFSLLHDSSCQTVTAQGSPRYVRHPIKRQLKPLHLLYESREREKIAIMHLAEP